MRRRRLLFVVLLVSFSCKRESPRPSSERGPAAEVRIGGDADAPPRLSFVIDDVHEGQRPSTAAPWHEAGGEWRFFDAHLADGSRLGFGFTAGHAARPAAFGKAMLTVPDSAHGAKLAERLASTFRGRLPPATRRAPLQIKPISAAVLGENAGRTDDGFSGPGSWTAMKLFLQTPGIEAEVFFNFDLVSRAGEFAEKDADYADGIVSFVARELRDGPPPPRTPETDPGVSAVGPKLEAWRVVHTGKAAFFKFESGSVLFTVSDGTVTRMMSAPLEGGAALEIARTETRFAGLNCAARAPHVCLVGEMQRLPGDLPGFAVGPSSYSVLDRKKMTKRALVPPVADAQLGLYAPVSPDGEWVVFTELKPISKGGQQGARRRYSALYLTRLDGGATKIVEDEPRWLEVVGWTGSGTGLRAVVQDGQPFDRDAKPSWFLVDPRTGARKPVPAPPARSVKDESLSPDGKHRVRCKEGAIVVSEVASGAEKRIPVHPDDQAPMREEDCVSWASARYLRYFVDRIGVIDIESSKLSYLFPPGEEPEHPIELSPDLGWAVSTEPDGLRIAKVVVR